LSATNENTRRAISDEIFPDGNILLNKLDVKKNGNKSKPSAITAAVTVRESNGFRNIFIMGELVIFSLCAHLE
jgi:hypothetical protein